MRVATLAKAAYEKMAELQLSRNSLGFSQEHAWEKQKEELRSDWIKSMIAALGKAPSLADKIAFLENYSNEIAFGYNDSGCFWHFQYGPRGAGNMIEGIGETFSALDADNFEEAVDAFLEHLNVDLASVEAPEE